MMTAKKLFIILIITSITLASFVVASSVKPKSANSEAKDTSTKKCKAGIFGKKGCDNKTNPDSPIEDKKITKKNIISDLVDNTNEVKSDKVLISTAPETDLSTDSAGSAKEAVESGDFSTTEIIVNFNNDNPKIQKPYKLEFLEDLDNQYPISKIDKLDPEDKIKSISNYYLIKFDNESDIDSVLEICNNYTDDVKSCEKNYFAKTLSDPDDPITKDNDVWYFSKLNLNKAWKMTLGSKDVKIAVLDDGYDLSHEDLKHNIVTSTNINTIGSDNLEHGTAVLGLIAATGNNNKGITGVMWDSSLYPYFPTNSVSKMQVDDSKFTVKTINMPTGNIVPLLKIVSDAISNNYKIVFLPFAYAGSVKNGAANLIIKEASDKGIIFITASSYCDGNNCEAKVSPQDFDQVIVVNSIDSTFKTSANDNKDNNYNTVSVPGVGLITTKANNSYYEKTTKFSGSSGASALLTGIVGLMLSVNNNLNFTSVKNILFNTSIDLGDGGFDKTYGHGLVDACMAVLCSIKDNQKMCFDKSGFLAINENDTMCKRDDLPATSKEVLPVNQVPAEAPFPKSNPNSNPVKKLIPIPQLK